MKALLYSSVPSVTSDAILLVICFRFLLLLRVVLKLHDTALGSGKLESIFQVLTIDTIAPPLLFVLETP